MEAAPRRGREDDDSDDSDDDDDETDRRRRREVIGYGEADVTIEEGQYVLDRSSVNDIVDYQT